MILLLDRFSLLRCTCAPRSLCPNMCNIFSTMPPELRQLCTEAEWRSLRARSRSRLLRLHRQAATVVETVLQWLQANGHPIGRRLTLILDNTAADHKNLTLLTYLASLVKRRVVREAHNLLPEGRPYVQQARHHLCGAHQGAALDRDRDAVAAPRGAAREAGDLQLGARVRAARHLRRGCVAVADIERQAALLGDPQGDANPVHSPRRRTCRCCQPLSALSINHSPPSNHTHTPCHHTARRRYAAARYASGSLHKW